LILLLYDHKRYQKEFNRIISLLEKFQFKNDNNFENNKIFLDTYETDIYNRIKKKLLAFPCDEMHINQREFLNGVVRKFRPKKNLEIGVNKGCSSSIILIKIWMIHIYFLLI
jgi:hypothetical protein